MWLVFAFLMVNCQLPFCKAKSSPKGGRRRRWTKDNFN